MTDSPPDTNLRPVVATAMDMFTARSYEEVSLEDIALASGVPGGECYRRYGSKLGIYLAALHQTVDDAVDTVVRDGPEDTPGRLRYVLRAYLEGLTANPSGHLYLSAEAFSDVEQRFREDLRRTVTRMLLACVNGAPRDPLRTLMPGWVALAESMLCDWVRHGVPHREALETVLCDLFFAFVETAEGAHT